MHTGCMLAEPWLVIRARGSRRGRPPGPHLQGLEACDGRGMHACPGGEGQVCAGANAPWGDAEVQGSVTACGGRCRAVQPGVGMQRAIHTSTRREAYVCPPMCSAQAPSCPPMCLAQAPSCPLMCCIQARRSHLVVLAAPPRHQPEGAPHWQPPPPSPPPPLPPRHHCPPPLRV